MNLIGMGLMLWGAIATRQQRHFGPAVLASGWAWTTATFWQATRGRYWMASHGMPLYSGTVELVLAPALTALAFLALVGSLILVLRGDPRGDAAA